MRVAALGLVSAVLLTSQARTARAPRDLGDGLPVAAPAAAGLDAAAFARISAAAGEAPRTTSVLVLSRGALVYEGYFGGSGPDALRNTRSATKSVTALAVGAAIADGKLASVSEPVLARFPEGARKPPDPLADGITVEDLLTMSSALDCDDGDDASPGNEENMYPQRAWLPWVLAIPTRPGWRRDAAGRGPFSYCTAGVFLLGQLVQRATGERVDRYVERRVLAPLGISRSEWPRSPSGEVMTGGGLALRSRDLAKLGAMIADGGRWRGKEVVPASFLERALTVQRRASADQDYGYLFWRRDWATRCGPRSGWYMAGNGGNAVVVLRDLGAVVVVTREAYSTRGMHEQTIRLVEDAVLPAFPCGAAR